MKWGYVPKTNKCVCVGERERERKNKATWRERKEKTGSIYGGVGGCTKGGLSLLPPFIIMLVEVVGGVSRGYAIVERIDPTLHTMPSHIIYLSVYLSN